MLCLLFDALNYIADCDKLLVTATFNTAALSCTEISKLSKFETNFSWLQLL